MNLAPHLKERKKDELRVSSQETHLVSIHSSKMCDQIKTRYPLIN
jgi:hypothetical protein